MNGLKPVAASSRKRRSPCPEGPRRALAAPLLGPVLAALLALGPVPQPARAAPADGPDLILEIRLGNQLVSDATGAFQQGDDVYLPLGELARLLTLAIRAQPGEGRASGYILKEERGFLLDVAAGSVAVDGRHDSVAPSDLLVKADDIYVASRVLARWLPVALQVDMASLTVQVNPREKLPLQARLERQAGARTAGPAAAYADPGYPLAPTPYALVDAPFVDQTLGLNLRPGANTASYSAYAAADLLGMEAALYVSRGEALAGPAARLTLGRRDPGGGLLGPLHARTALFGSIATPGVPNIAQGSAGGNGIMLSNRPLSQPVLLDRHSLRGDLPPGWDVELYYNEALVGFQQSGADGKYNFADLPLNYGPNDFRLVFHGPLGQLRVERHSFLLEQSLLAAGEVVYQLTHQRSSGGGRHSVANLDWGLNRQLSASAGLVQTARNGSTRSYASLGVNGYWNAFMAAATLTRAEDGGRLAQFALKTRVMGMALGGTRAWADRFVSDYFQAGPDAVRVRDELRIDGPIAAVQLSMLAKRERLASSRHNTEVAVRASTFRFGTAISNALHWQSRASQLLGSQADGALQASRRVAGIGVSGQLTYALRPDARLSALAISADKRIGQAWLLNLSASHSFIDPQYRLAASLNKSLGRIGFGVGAFHTSRGDMGASVQLFTALGREPRRALWAADAAPLAASGAASIRVFLDRNRNGVMDGDDEPVSGAGFALNGTPYLARTGADGVAYLNRLTPYQYLDVAVDPDTLEDPQWQAQKKGMRIVPRAGKVSQLEFAVGITGEVDGTTYLVSGGKQRAISDVELELVDEQGVVAATGTSSSDGYYIISAVAPGRYRLRVAPGQLQRLAMHMAAGLDDGIAIVMKEDGTFVNGKDLVLAPLSER
ncbi:MAG: collagen binding domain-containing protein [Gammaproteobacteria bacterium]